jgi:FKBP-type peptidyl-prolyl cis-trans isomerase SlyD
LFFTIRRGLHPSVTVNPIGSHLSSRAVTVTQIAGDMVTIDANHPLAGQNLNFDVEIAAVRAATEEELAHGHVHGPGGHHDH